MIAIIQKKKKNLELNEEEIRFVVDGFTNDKIPDYQMSAFLMAIYFNKMTFKELSTLTELMMKSGEIIDLSSISGFKSDKHSTGGVGDKVSIPLIAIAAACGVKVPMISGRGLGHTGGTLDKLESIKGFSVSLTEQQFMNNVEKVGCCLIGQTKNIAPADKKIYALRDVTCTVDSIPLISASIMSKKLASGTDGLVLDVKTGSGAFMKTQEQAEDLAQTMIQIGKNLGKKMTALITNMNQPLGYAIGNAVEIEESVELLKGNKVSNDISDIILEFAGHMCYQSGVSTSIEEGKKLAQEVISSGKALKKFEEMVQAQGGDISFINDYSQLPQPKLKVDIIYPGENGYIESVNTQEVGELTVKMGAGRATKDSILDLSVGMRIFVKIGDEVQKNQKIGELYLSSEEQKSYATEILKAFTISKTKVEKQPIIYKVLQ